MITTNASKQDLLTKQCQSRIYAVLNAQTLDVRRLSNRFGLLNRQMLAVMLSHAIHAKLADFNQALSNDNFLLNVIAQFHDAKRTLHIENGYIAIGVKIAKANNATSIIDLMRVCAPAAVNASSQKLDLSGLSIAEKQERALAGFKDALEATKTAVEDCSSDFKAIDTQAHDKLHFYEKLELTGDDLKQWLNAQPKNWLNSEVGGHCRGWWFEYRIRQIDRDLLLEQLAELHERELAA